MNYIGSKYSLLPFLDECITSVAGDCHAAPVLCDIFAGTGAVGRHFKQKGYRIIANDLQYYSYVLNRHYIGNHKELTFDGLSDELARAATSSLFDDRYTAVCNLLNSLEPREGFIFNNYCKGNRSDGEEYRLYFSNENGAKCDAIRLKIEEWKSAGRISDDEYFFLLTTLLEGIDKVANTASVYGAFLKKLKASALKPLTMTPAKLYCNDIDHAVFNTDANRLIQSISPDILYLDPPYNHRQYSSNYHVLETIARYDNPPLRGKTGMRDNRGQQSLYCSRAKVKTAFAELINAARARFIFLSYNNEGLMTPGDIREIMSARGRYGCFTREYSRFKADKESASRHIKADSTTEFLHFVEVTR